jgi:ribonuclease HI
MATDNTLTELELHKKDTCYIFSDGSCWKPGGRGAAAWVAVYDFDVTYSSRCFSNTTNNQMELTAALDGLYWAAENGFEKVVLISDSQYTLSCIGEYPKKWVATNWLIKGEPVKNQDLIKPLLQVAKRFKHLELHWTRGHAGCFYNEKADAMAEGFREYRPTTVKNYDGPLSAPTCHKHTFEAEHLEPGYYEQKKREDKLKKKEKKLNSKPYVQNQFALFQ